jgi:hypothetical protein
VNTQNHTFTANTILEGVRLQPVYGIQAGQPKINLDLTIEIRTKDGANTQFYQSDEDSIGKLLSVLNTPRLFSQPLITLASERSVSSVPTRAIDVILVRTPTTPPVLLPPDWLDIVEVDAEAFHIERSLMMSNEDTEGLLPDSEGITFFLEIHTFGDWVIVLKLQAAMRATIPDQRQRFAQFFEIPVIPFRLPAGGVGFINPGNISRVTVYPAFAGVAENRWPADLLRCIRS